MKRFYFIITIILSCGLPMFGQEPADTLKSKQLDEVVVSAKLLERKGNEDIITVTKSMREGTKNVGELLGRVTGVFYNPLTTDLQYLGSKNILILVDGVEKTLITSNCSALNDSTKLKSQICPQESMPVMMR